MNSDDRLICFSYGIEGLTIRTEKFSITFSSYSVDKVKEIVQKLANFIGQACQFSITESPPNDTGEGYVIHKKPTPASLEFQTETLIFW